MAWKQPLIDTAHAASFLSDLNAGETAIEKKDEASLKTILEFRSDDGKQSLLELAQYYIIGVQRALKLAIELDKESKNYSFVEGLMNKLMFVTGCFVLKADMFIEFMVEYELKKSETET